jgi:hypothetical protein
MVPCIALPDLRTLHISHSTHSTHSTHSLTFSLSLHHICHAHGSLCHVALGSVLYGHKRSHSSQERRTLVSTASGLSQRRHYAVVCQIACSLLSLVFACAHFHFHFHKHTHTHSYTHTHTHTHINTLHSLTHSHIHTHIHTFIPTHSHIYTHLHTLTRTHPPSGALCAPYCPSASSPLSNPLFSLDCSVALRQRTGVRMHTNSCCIRSWPSRASPPRSERSSRPAFSATHFASQGCKTVSYVPYLRISDFGRFKTFCLNKGALDAVDSTARCYSIISETHWSVCGEVV